MTHVNACQELHASQGGAPGKEETLLNLQGYKGTRTIQYYKSAANAKVQNNSTSSTILHFIDVLLTTVFGNNVSQTLKIFFLSLVRQKLDFFFSY